jgi:hypothetical protein
LEQIAIMFWVKLEQYNSPLKLKKNIQIICYRLYFLGAGMYEVKLVSSTVKAA